MIERNRLEHGKNYTLLLHTGERVTATFLKERIEPILTEISVSFKPEMSFVDTGTFKHTIHRDTFFAQNKPIDNDTIRSIEEIKPL